ncbi:MAG TPA: bacteriocin fulvocin C-related protein [Longimicrobium sp.]|jgi:hypothetical protein|nr:bacteriocin fulvocin C-related protein [Longimicrobium sp.]
MRKRIAAPVLAVLLTTTLGSAAPRPEPPECAVAAAWVRAHQGALPTTLAGLSRHSKLYRRAIYDALPPATREAMWREQLEGYLRPGQPLTETQKAAVRQVIAQLPALTAVHPDQALARSLRAQLSTQFERPLLRQVFFALGPASAQPEPAANGRRPLCDCDGDGDCFPGTTCKPVLCSFTTGCGVSGAETCTGVCRP